MKDDKGQRLWANQDYLCLQIHSTCLWSDWLYSQAAPLMFSRVDAAVLRIGLLHSHEGR